MRLIFSPRFEDELVSIADFIAIDSPKRADLFVDGVERACLSLIDMPYKCRKSLKFDDENVRDLIYKGYVVPYRIKKTILS